MSDRRTIAVPAETPEGLSAPRSHHFGHAPFFVLADLDGTSVTNVRALANPPHIEGGCGLTVGLLAQAGATDVVAWGMGGGPRRALPAAGISAYSERTAEDVEGAIRAFAAGAVEPFGDAHQCQGHHDH